MLAFRADMEKDFSSFHDWFQAMKVNAQEIIDILKMKEEANEFEIVTPQAPIDPPPQ